MPHSGKTATDLIREFEHECQPFARALLLKVDRTLLEDLLAMIYFHSAPIAYAASPEPFQLFTLAMNIGILKRVVALETIIKRHPEIANELAELWTDNNIIGSLNNP